MRVPGGHRIRRLARDLRGRLAVRGLILMYHRIADLDSDPWGLAVTPAHFAEHMAVLGATRSAVPLRDLEGALSRRSPPRRPIVVTFDDGYADNVAAALPLLAQHRVPATMFLATGAIGAAREFWWDELGRVLLEPRALPAVLDLRRADWSYRFELGAGVSYTAEAYANNRLWRAWEPPPTARHAMYAELWRHFYALPHSQKRGLLDDLLAWAGLEAAVRATHGLVSLADVQELGRTSLVEIGAHTVTHPALPELPIVDQTKEIVQSKRILEEVLRRPVSSFAYPHGHHAPATVSVVCEAGFTSACTTDAGSVSRGANRLTLPRFQIMDWNGEEFRARLHAWRNCDGPTSP